MRLATLRRFLVGSAAIGAAVVLARPSVAAISYTGTPYSESFDTLPNTPESPSSGSNMPVSWANDSTLAGWSIFKKPAPGTAVPTILVAAGSNNTGSAFSFGTSGDTDRALGGLGSGGAYWGSPATGALAGWYAVAITNNSSSAINAVTVNYDGEQWRNGGNASPQTMVLEYGVGASFDAVTWTAPGGTFDFISPITGASAATLNGNDAANRHADLGGELSTTWAVGDTLWFRWIENNDAGNDHALAVDNFKLSSGAVVTPTNNSDFDDDGDVDGADFLTWQAGFGLTEETGKTHGNANADTAVDGLDLAEWTAHFGGAPAGAVTAAVPEPTGAGLLLAGALCLAGRRRRAG